ncbi:pyrroline-5-carboxylate reductase [Brevibacillus choshinensis]|uniref:pyrroline-5-carboxylate reductase n=1 Tax=Brevibacillus choshinensis TaxID=54911 RepID=UPI002E219608|nr:pyrroline-5-carboxylate reductase [Brevibacillus choshinensis]MED4584042.1 pyrroline-5-carboxylate reductase [Brevibacillus choshinensis]MED4755347.1 pyrroline-5-carboxylate reductase [Brevibacillus choshinensis]MED4783986.1 pyrroline-5-carboxylate reductase [Brevibacillus choshinensis]
MNNHQASSIEGRIGFLGAGSIVEAMLSGILKKGLFSANRVYVTNRSNSERLDLLTETYGVNTTHEKMDVIKAADILILAMKPKDSAEALKELAGSVHPGQLVISVIAGVSTTLIGEWLGVNCPIIRTMPNTSSAVGLSATGLAANQFVTEDQLLLATRLFEAIGTVYTVAEEELDIVTGLSGSGPAYIYYLVEAMMGAGATAGLDREMARQLTLQTLLGAAHMLMDTREEPALLRKKVTSPGGTTQAGLEVLESYQFQEAVTSAILRATERSREMGAAYQ